jgi:hypothetical protein
MSHVMGIVHGAVKSGVVVDVVSHFIGPVQGTSLIVTSKSLGNLSVPSEKFGFRSLSTELLSFPRSSASEPFPPTRPTPLNTSRA